MQRDKESEKLTGETCMKKALSGYSDLTKAIEKNRENKGITFGKSHIQLCTMCCILEVTFSTSSYVYKPSRSLVTY